MFEPGKTAGDTLHLNSLGESYPCRLLLAAVVHDELVHLKPFATRNEQLAIIVHKRSLDGHAPVSEDIPFEATLASKREAYLELVNNGSSKEFVHFLLRCVDKSVRNHENEMAVRPCGPLDRLEHARKEFHRIEFLVDEYAKLHHNLPASTAQKDLLMGIRKKILARGRAGSANAFWYA